MLHKMVIIILLGLFFFLHMFAQTPFLVAKNTCWGLETDAHNSAESSRVATVTFSGILMWLSFRAQYNFHFPSTSKPSE